MKIAYFIKKSRLQDSPSIASLLVKFQAAGHQVYNVAAGLQDSTDMLISFGGDGTFLSAASLVCQHQIPLLGVNLGRMGFLSDTELALVEEGILSGNYHIEERCMLQISPLSPIANFFPYALNEVAVRRLGTGTLALEAKIDGEPLPTYWADGLLLSTSSGSTGYSLSVGGPICMPSVDAFVLAPIAPHNLNLRPLLLPTGAEVEIVAKDRKGAGLALSLDNRDYVMPSGSPILVQSSPYKLRKVVLGKSGFIEALRTKLLWGEDVRNV